MLVKQLKMKQKCKTVIFSFHMLLGTLGATLFENLLEVKRVTETGEEATRLGQIF